MSNQNINFNPILSELEEVFDGEYEGLIKPRRLEPHEYLVDPLNTSQEDMYTTPLSIDERRLIKEMYDDFNPSICCS